ncbi:MAG: hypothetical protein IKF90_10120 [Parasporobacterium sp.]|nr:hypothetical protein [Parasporobacterium sp.]
MKHNVEIRVFRCPECGHKAYAPKRRKYRTNVGHIKDMWCPYCGKEQKFEQVEVK